MTLKQTERLLQLLAKYKVYHYKSDHLELHRENIPERDAAQPEPPSPTPERVQKPLGDIVPSTSTIPHHVNEVSALLKLDDFSLVDRLFPDHTQPSED